MATMRESLNSWIGNNYSFCKDGDNTICDKFPISSRLTMIEATSMSGIPHWPEGEEGLVIPTYTEYAAPIKDDLALGTLVKAEGAYRAIAPRTKDTAGIFYTRSIEPGPSPADVVDALIYDDKITCIGTPGTFRSEISCYTKKEPQWSKWRGRILELREENKNFNKAIAEVFRDEKTGKPLKGRKLRRILAGTEIYYYKPTDPAMEPILKRLNEIGKRLTELRGFEKGPRLGDVELGLIAKSQFTTEEEAVVMAEQDTLRDERKVILKQIKEIGDIANIDDKTLKLRDKRELILEEIAERIGMRLRNGKTSSLEIEADNIYGEILELQDRRNAILELIEEIGDTESLQNRLGDIDDRLLELQEELDYFKDKRTALKEELLQEEESLKEEERRLNQELGKIRTEREKDKPDPEKYRKWQGDLEREFREFYHHVEKVVSATKHGYYIGESIYPDIGEFQTTQLTEDIKKRMIKRGFEKGYEPLIQRGQPSLIDECILYEEALEKEFFEEEPERPQRFERPKEPERAEKPEKFPGLGWPEKPTWIERYRSFFSKKEG